MNRIARNWRVLAGGVAAGSAAVLGLTGTSASADPIVPAPPAPAPVTVTQTVTVAPQAAPQAASQATVPATAAVAGAGVPATPAVAGAQVPAAPAAAGAQVPVAPSTAAVGIPAADPLSAPASSAAPVAPTAPPITAATAGTLAEFFKEKGVAVEPQKATGFTALNLVLPVPSGWTLVPDPNVSDAFTVIADRKGGDALYTPNAQLKVYKLVGEFDPREAIGHGYIDTQQLQTWQQTDASLAEFDGFPSAEIEGTYRDGDSTLNTTRRHVIAQSGSDRYLVSLYVTTAANQVVATAAATEAILKGFKVADPASPAPVAAPPAPVAAPPAPASAPVIDAAAAAAPVPGAVPAPAAVPAPTAPAPAAPGLPVTPVAPAPAAALPAPAPVIPLTVSTQ